MRVGAGHAVEEFVAHRLAGDGGAGVEDFLHRRAVARGGLMGRQPFRIAAAGDVAGDVVHVLDHRGEAGERPVGGALDRGLEVVRDEAAAIDLRHFGFSRYGRASRYQSRIFAPSHATTPSCDKISAKVFSTWPMRCGTPER